MDTILIIDDEPMIRKLLSRIMGLEGYEVLQAVDCASGMKQIKTGNPQVVLCDVLLPDGNGVDMVSAIKNHIPILKSYCLLPTEISRTVCKPLKTELSIILPKETIIIKLFL